MIFIEVFMNRIILNLQEELNKDIILKDFYNNNLSKIISIF